MKKIVITKKAYWIEFGAGIILLGLFFLFTWLLIRSSDQLMRSDLLQKAEHVSLAINDRYLSEFSGTKSDVDLVQYQRLKEQLQLSRFLHPDIRFLYLLGINPDGSIFIQLDSEEPGSPEESLPGDIYNEATQQHRDMFSDMKAEVIGPVEDYWGNRLTALVPIINQNNGKVEALLGIDIDAQEWNQAVIQRVLFPIIILFVLHAFIFISLHFVLHRKQLPTRLFLWRYIKYGEIAFSIVFGILITTILTWFRIQNEFIDQKGTFTRLASARSGYITTYMNNLENIYLEGIKNFFEGSEFVNRQEFNNYTSALASDSNVLAWGWFPELKPEEISAFETEMRASGIDNYQIWQMDNEGNKGMVEDRPLYYPIAYVYPSEINEVAYGFDHGSDQIRLEAILEAKNSNLTTASDPTLLLQTNYGDLGVLVYKFIPNEDSENKQNGFVQAIINMESLLQVALGQSTTEVPLLYVDLFQIKEQVPPILLASNTPAEFIESHQESLLHDHPYSSVAFNQPIFAFGKVYVLTIHPGQEFSQAFPNTVGWSTALLGIVITLLTSLIIKSFVSRRYTLEKMVLERTVELSQSEQKYKNLAESTSAVLWEYDVNLDKWTYIAPQVTIMTGWQPDDFKNLQFWVDHVYQDDREWAEAYRVDFIERGEDYEFEYRFNRPDGSYLWIRDVVNTEVIDGIPTFLRGYMLDITKRKQAEESHLLQSTALEASINAIVITNKGGQIQWANPAFEQLTGFRIDESIGKNPGSLFHSGVQEKDFYESMWKTILSGIPWRGELVNKRRDGSLYNEEMSITPVKNIQREITHFIAIKQDINERKQHEFELIALEKINSTIRFANSRAELMPILLDQIMELFQAEGSALVIFDPSTNSFHLESVKGVFEGTLKQNLDAGLSISGIVFESGKPFVSDDISKEEGIVWSEAYNIAKSIACVPLFVEGLPIGNLRIGRSYEISAADVRLLLSIAEIVANAIHREMLREETIKQLDRLSTLRSIDQVLNSIVDLRVILNYILEQVSVGLKMDAVAIHLYNSASHRFQYADGTGFHSSEIEITNVLIGEYNLGKAALHKKTICIPDVKAEDFPGGQLFQKEKFVSYFVTPIIVKGQIKGAIELFNRSRFSPDDDWISFFEILAGQTAIAIDNSQLFEGLQRSNLDISLAYDATIEGWSRAMDLRDKETEGHTLRVTELTLKLARLAGMSETEIIHVRRGALLHDMGKLGIPDGILHKPGPLNKEEWELMRKHPVFAYEMLAPIKYLKQAMDIPYCHHEKMDGSGYPRGLKGEEIPLAARIFSVVDVYDALTSNRPYRSAWTKEKAIEYISNGSGSHFDPLVVELFFQLVHSEPDFLYDG